MLIQTPPASGKTTLAKSNPDVFDLDDLIFEILGLNPSKKTTLGLKLNPDFPSLQNKVETLLAEGKHVLTNVDPFWLFGINADFALDYGSDYIEHIKLVGRKDLLANFSESELASWMDNYGSNAKHVTRAKAGTFISDMIS